MNRLYAYIVRWDDGFAPNPFHGVLTLACCKRVIRRVAQVGDYIVGLSSKPDNHIVYAMRVSETMTFDESRYERGRHRSVGRQHLPLGCRQERVGKGVVAPQQGQRR